MNEFCQSNEADIIIARALKCLEERFYFEKGVQLHSAKSVCDYLRLQLGHEKNEIFAALFLDSQNRLLSFEKMFHGTVNETMIYPRCVVQRALELNASSIIIAHNHPSGVSRPSYEDKRVTEDLKRILGIINVRLLDHIVVALTETYSFADHGLM